MANFDDYVCDSGQTIREEREAAEARRDGWEKRYGAFERACLEKASSDGAFAVAYSVLQLVKHLHDVEDEQC